MKIQLVKEYDRRGAITYYVTADDQYIPGTVSLNLPDAMDQYSIVKEKYTQARKEVLIEEEV